MILALRTDKPEAELYLLNEKNQVEKCVWQADRSLADTLLVKIKDFLNKHKVNYSDLNGVIVFTGQGSFTGLRISTTVANTIAFGLKIPIVKASGKNWINNGFNELSQAKNVDYVVPDYDSEPNIS